MKNMAKLQKQAVALFCVLTMIVQVFSPIHPMSVKADTVDDGVIVLDEGDTSDKYEAPDSPAVTYNMNIDWKYKRAVDGKVFPLAAAKEGVMDASGKQFYEVGYDDSGWETVSVPHAINAEDSFDGVGVDAGEASLYRGFMFYRKNITVPATDAGKKFILEFEAFRQAIYVYVNGQMAGYYEAGVAAVGFDLTDYIVAGEQNLIAVATENMSGRGSDYQTQETIPGHEPGDVSGSTYQWNQKDFNEVQGGLTGNVYLYAKNKIYQTLPLYNNLKTRGNYIHADKFDFRAGSADIIVEAEIRNETADAADITLEVDVVDSEGKVAASFAKTQSVAAATDTADDQFLTMVPVTAYEGTNGVENGKADTGTVQVTTIKATQNVAGLKFWSDVAPNLYDVYTILKQGDTVIDVQKITTGFREVTYDKDKGLMINGVPTYLAGYAQRSTNEWAAIGVANDWLSDIDMKLVKESNANMIRWMHIAPNPVDIRAGDKYGVISICPAGDKEADVTGRQWDQRLETMRDVIIYYRNSPSVFFWEAGNNQITPAHMKQMTDLRKELDPSGYRFMGCRTINTVDQIKEAEWVGTMLYRNDAAAYTSMQTLNKYIPMIETEYHRNEAPRRVWDDYTPDDYDYVNKWLGDGGSKTDGFDVWDQTQEDFVRTMVNPGDGYSYYYNNRVGGSGKNYYSGAAMMVWSDSNMHVRNCGVENARTSGRVDPIRLKKESFYAVQAVQAKTPTINIIGHWNYPKYIKGDRENGNYWYEDKTFNGTFWEGNGTWLQRDPTNKTVYVMGSQGIAKVELYVNGKSVGTDTKPDDNYIYAFPKIDVTQSGKVSAKAYNDREEVVAEDEVVTSGPKATIRLKPMWGPEGFLADGSDMMYVDVEMVDDKGNICLIDESKISFKVSDPTIAKFLGGYNSGVGDRIVNHKDYVFAECGINRVFLQSTRKAGTFSLTATSEGLTPVTLNLESKEFATQGGLTTVQPQAYGQGPIEDVTYNESAPALKSLGQVFTADFSEESGNVYEASEDKKDYYEVTVNGTPVTFTDRAYKPDSITGVVGEVGPIVEALKAAGVDVDCIFHTEGDVPAYLAGQGGVLPWMQVVSGDTKIELANVSTNVFTNETENNLTNFGVTTNSASTTLLAELSSVIGKIPNVSANSDDEKKVYAIMVAAAQDDEIEVSDAEVKGDELAADTVAGYSDCNSAYGSFTLSSDSSPDGTSYWKNATGDEIKVDGAGFALPGDSIADLLWEADVRFDKEDGGVVPKNKSGNYGTCIRRHNNKLSVQTGGGSNDYKSYCDIDENTWYHIELLGRYSAPDANIDMTVYKYNGNKKEKIDTYKGVNLRNLSVNNKSGAMCWAVYAGASVDNLKITRLAADKITVTAKDNQTKVVAGNLLQFEYSTTRQGAYITKPAVTWSVCNADGTKELSDENISIDAYGVLNVGIGLAESKTIAVKATVKGTTLSDFVKIQVESVSLDNVKFDALTLSADRAYVKAGEPLKITAAASKNGKNVALGADDLIWYVCDAANMRKLGDNLKWIHVANGELTVDEKVISQDITIRAADKNDIVRGAYQVHVKSSDALEDGEDGTIDSLLFADNCEAARSGAALVPSVDGTSGYEVTAAYSTANIPETTSDIVVEMDIRFSKEGAGFQPAKNGKLNTCVIYHNGKLSVQTGGSAFTPYSEEGEVTTEDWYHLTLIRKQDAYAHMIFDFYDENGNIDLSKRKILKDLNQRNNEATAFVNFNVGTMYDNLRVLSPVPTDIGVSTDVQTVFAGGTVQASATLLWNGLEMKKPDSTNFEYKIYDAENRYPLGSDKITIDGNGLITVDATVDAQDVWLRAVAKKSGKYVSAKISIKSADIFTVDSIGIDEAKKRIVELKVNRNFFYKDEVTFITEIFGENGSVKAVSAKLMYGEALRTGENTVAIGMDLPADFDKAKDTIKVFSATRISTDSATTENTQGTCIKINDGSAAITTPAYDMGADVLVLLLKRDADETNVQDSDILYVNQVKAHEVGNAVPTGDAVSCIAKTGGKRKGEHVVYAAIDDNYEKLTEPVDKTALETLYNKVKDYKEADFTEGWSDFTAAKGKAEAVLANDDATDMEVLFALTDLRKATDNLKGIVNKTELQALYNEVKDYKEADYVEGWVAFESARIDAKTVLEDDDATQVQVLSALADLQTAVNGLKKKADPEPGIPDDSEGDTENKPSAKKYTITYVLNKGTQNKKNPAFYSSDGQDVKLQNPTRKGYTFDGWYTDKACSKKNKITTIKKNAGKNYTLYARWTKVRVDKAKISSATNAKCKKLTVKIKKVSGAAGYEISYTTDKKFKKKITKKTTTKTSYTIKNLKKGKTYYVKVRAYKKDSTGSKVYGKLSGVKKVKIKK